MPVKQSASKEEFLKEIGLGAAPAETRDRLFGMMWEEVTHHWNLSFESASRSMLKPEYASNPAVQRPYKWGHLSPDRINHAIRDIWANGRPQPRHYYDMGRSEDPKVYNWVLKWLLWHVCRYRDWRNRKASNAGVQSTGNCIQGIVGGGSETGAMPTQDFWSTVLN